MSKKKKKEKKQMKIYLTSIGKLVALGEISLRAREEGITVDEYLKNYKDPFVEGRGE